MRCNKKFIATILLAIFLSVPAGQVFAQVGSVLGANKVPVKDDDVVGALTGKGGLFSGINPLDQFMKQLNDIKTKANCTVSEVGNAVNKLNTYNFGGLELLTSQGTVAATIKSKIITLESQLDCVNGEIKSVKGLN